MTTNYCLVELHYKITSKSSGHCWTLLYQKFSNTMISCCNDLSCRMARRSKKMNEYSLLISYIEFSDHLFWNEQKMRSIVKFLQKKKYLSTLAWPKCKLNYTRRYWPNNKSANSSTSQVLTTLLCSSERSVIILIYLRVLKIHPCQPSETTL